MTKQTSGPKDVPTKERMGILAAATKDAAGLKAAGQHETEKGALWSVGPLEVEQLTAAWPSPAKKVLEVMMKQYGPPNEATPTKLLWYRNGPWKRSLLTSDELVHNFPSPHTDFLTQTIDYRVPTELLDELGRFDGSCLVDRTAGEVAARCDSEAANFLTLNLMHDIVTGRRTVEEARTFYAETMVAYTMGREAPYCEGLLFPVVADGAEDPDEAVAGPGTMARQAVGKVKDVLTGRERDASSQR